jgi:SAM-dependent MidA family methyltransferase
MENFIDVRAQQLLKKAPTREDREKILQGFARLINDDAMGSLFKVLLLQGPAA